ncbi:hypothetical protein K8T06_08925 [bacterium]|nr:hypothetical protein [bacterium]
MKNRGFNQLINQIHPLVWILTPGLLSLTIAPANVVLWVSVGLLAFILPGIVLARLFLENRFHHHFLWATAIPLGYLISTALSVVMTNFLGFQPWLCLGTSLIIGVSGIIFSAKHRSVFPVTSPSALPTPPITILFTGLIIVSIIVGFLTLSYAKVGIETTDGVAYRAYYSGDYLKHLAITAELTRGVIPPDNPYYAGEQLHYYWMFYLFPAIITEITSPDSLEPVLKTINLYLAAVFIWLWILTSHRFLARTWIRFLVILTPFFFASFEGLAVLREVRNKGWPWGGFRAYNIDGYSRWILGHPEIDTIFRLLQYNIQHIIPAALFLVFLNIFHSFKQITRRQATIMGLLCGLTIGQSGFLGSFLTLWTGLCLIILGPWTRKGLKNRITLGSLMSITPIFALVIYKSGFQMLGSTGNPLILTMVKPITQHPIRFLILNFGIAVLGIPALINWRRFHRPAIILAILAFIWVAFIIVPDWPSDVGVKVGYTLALALALLCGQLLDQLPRKKWFQFSVAGLVYFAGLLALPSLLTEVYNSGDLENKRYVSTIDPADWNAYRYIRDSFPVHARVQTGPGTEINAPFSPIPTFARRHTYCGDWMHAHIFLIPEHLYLIRLDQITRMFTSKDPVLVHKLCRDAGITHLYWGANEYRAYGSAVHLIQQKKLFSTEWSDVTSEAQLHLLKVL